MSVNVRAEIYALLFDFSKSGQGKYLESTGICKYRSVPDHEFVKTAKLLYNFISGAHVKVICVRKLHLRSNIVKVHCGNCSLNRPDGSHIHKNRSLNRSMYCMEFRPFCSSFCFQDFIFCHLFSSFSNINVIV